MTSITQTLGRRRRSSNRTRFDGVVVEQAGDAVPPITADDARRQSSSMLTNRWAVSRPPSPKRSSTDFVRRACQTRRPFSKASWGVLVPWTSRAAPLTLDRHRQLDRSTRPHDVSQQLYALRVFVRWGN